MSLFEWRDEKKRFFCSVSHIFCLSLQNISCISAKDKNLDKMRIIGRTRKRIIILALATAVTSLVIMFFYTMKLAEAREIEEREKRVIDYLSAIRNAELRYRQVHAVYCGSVDSLAEEGFIPDSVRYIPYSNGKKFAIRVENRKKANNEMMTLMECSADYRDFLNGMDKDVVERAVRNAQDKGRFTGLKFGDIDNNSDNIGNWE